MNVVLCGVGGNGVVLTTKIIAEAALKEDIRVRVGEVHGLAQRGGTVVSHLRLGTDAKGPMIPQRSGDVLIAFEPLEALRQMKMLRSEAKVILNNEPFVGVDAHLGLSKYPDLCIIMDALREAHDIVDVDATQLAIAAGSAVMTNVVMLGALSASGELPIQRETLLDAIKSRVPPTMVDNNVKAFESGEKAFHRWNEENACRIKPNPDEKR